MSIRQFYEAGNVFFPIIKAEYLYGSQKANRKRKKKNKNFMYKKEARWHAQHNIELCDASVFSFRCSKHRTV